MSIPVLRTVATLDRVLDTHAARLGADFAGYRHHTCRVLNPCAAPAAPDAEALERIALAAAFHDPLPRLTIWGNELAKTYP